MPELTFNSDLKSILERLRLGLEALYGDRLIQVLLFGSQARGDAGPYSDIDVLAILEGPVDPNDEIRRTSALRCELSLAFNTVVSCLYIDQERFLKRKGPLIQNIRREGIPI